MNISTQFNYWQKKFLILIFFVLLLPAYVFAHGDDGHAYAAGNDGKEGYGNSVSEAFAAHIDLSHDGMGNCEPKYHDTVQYGTGFIFQNGMILYRTIPYFISDGLGAPDRKKHGNGTWCNPVYLEGDEQEQTPVYHYVCPEGAMIHDKNNHHVCEISEPEPPIDPKTSPLNCESS